MRVQRLFPTILLCAAAVAAFAADESDGTRFHFDALRYPTVQKELELSPQQAAEINSLVKSYDDAFWKLALQGTLPDPQNVTEQERIRLIQAWNRERAPRFRRVTAQFASRFEKLLDVRQRQRLRQIDWQIGWKRTGGRVLQDAELVSAIGLSDQQRARLRAIDDEFRDKEVHLIYSDGAREGSPDGPKVIAAMERLYPDWNETMARVLTQEQRHKLEVRLGKPTDMPRLLKEIEQRQTINK